jgi:hypothetical protein
VCERERERQKESKREKDKGSKQKMNKYAAGVIAFCAATATKEPERETK